METTISRPETIDKLRYAVDAGFAMLAGLQLDIFTPLKDGAKTSEEIAQAIGVGPARLRLLLYGLVAAGLLTEQDGHFSNTPEANQYLVKGNPSYMGNMHEPFSHRWTNLYPHTADSIRRAAPQAKVDFSNAPPAEVEAFLRRINRNTVAAARALLKQFDFSSTRTLADVGCGGAGLALTMTKEFPYIRATAIDLPLVAPIAQKIVTEEGATDRVQVLAADLLSGPLPGSYDVLILRGVLQCLAAEEARIAIKNIAAAVNPGGTVYIIAQILDDSRLSPLEALHYNLIFLNTFDAGESYTEQEHRAWLIEAGFVDIERANFLLPDRHGLITARMPK